MKAMDMKSRIELELRGKDASTIKELNLDSCRAQHLEGLTEEFKSLEILSLINVGLTSLKGFPKLPALRKLELSDNRLSNGLDNLLGCPNLTHLNLSGNKIKEIEVLAALAQLGSLRNLDLFNCDVTQIDEYREKIFKMLPQLKFLDGFDQNEQEEDDEEEEDDEGADDDDGGDEDEDSEFDEEDDGELNDDGLLDDQDEDDDDDDDEDENEGEQDEEEDEGDEGLVVATKKVPNGGAVRASKANGAVASEKKPPVQVPKKNKTEEDEDSEEDEDEDDDEEGDENDVGLSYLQKSNLDDDEDDEDFDEAKAAVISNQQDDDDDDDDDELDDEDIGDDDNDEEGDEGKATTSSSTAADRSASKKRKFEEEEGDTH